MERGRARSCASWPQAGMTREDHLVALGGGVVGDLAGFCAHIYQRGVPVVQVPTTLVAQVDSAYGGKTGVDLPEGKNYAGAYHLPAAVLADTATLATLPPQELAAGFVEVLKTGLLAGGALWERVRAIETLDPDELDDVVFACARYKCEVVAADERDAGLRARAQPRPHRRPRDRGGERLSALPPRRGDRARPAGGAAALRAPRACATRSRRSSIATACRSDSTRAIAIDDVLDALAARQEAHRRRRRLRPPLRARASPAPGSSSIRLRSGQPWRSSTDDHRHATASPSCTGSTSTCSSGATRRSTAASRWSSWRRRSPTGRTSWSLEPIFFQTNSEGEFCEYLHRSAELADAVIVNAGAWTHYSRAIADALELTRLPAVEVHLSDVEARDDWRRLSVFDGLVLAKVSGKGPDGYREALELLAGELGAGG